MNKNKLITIIVLFSLCLTSVNAVVALPGKRELPPRGEAQGGIFKTNLKIEPTSLIADADGHFGTESASGKLFPSLVGADWGRVYGMPTKTGGVQPDLAYDWEVADDYLSYTFYLHNKVTFIDQQF